VGDAGRLAFPIVLRPTSFIWYAKFGLSLTAVSVPLSVRAVSSHTTRTYDSGFVYPNAARKASA
jgi:branched-subunit amino acid permease